MPQSGGVRHSLPVGVAHLLAVGQALAHVVQQEIGIGPDQLEGMRLVGASRRVTNFGVWQEAQPGS